MTIFNEHGHDPHDAQHESHVYTVVIIRAEWQHARHIRCTSMAEAEKIVRTCRKHGTNGPVFFTRTVRPAPDVQSVLGRSEGLAALAETEEI